MTKSNAMLELFQSMAERTAANPNMGLEDLRDMLEREALVSTEPEDVTYRNVSADGVDALWCLPAGAAEDRVVLFTHGGGFVTNTMHSHRKVAAHLAKAIGVRALIIDYRRAPEHPYPAPLDDVRKAFEWLLAQGFNAKNIVTAGDSAGGNLATALVFALREAGLPTPGAVVAFSPFYDMELAGETMDTNAATDAFVQRPILDNMVTFYIGEDGDRRDPMVNPLHGDLRGFPPLFLTAGGHETLLSDSERMAKLAADQGAEAVFKMVPEMQHIFIMMAGNAPQADDTLADVANWVRPKLGL